MNFVKIIIILLLIKVNVNPFLTVYLVVLTTEMILTVKCVEINFIKLRESVNKWKKLLKIVKFILIPKNVRNVKGLIFSYRISVFRVLFLIVNRLLILKNVLCVMKVIS